MPYVKRLFLFLFCTLGIAALGTIFSTNGTANSLAKAGADIGAAERVSMSLYDLAHFTPLYFLFVSLALLAAFIAAHMLHRIVKFGRPVIFTVAGGVAMAVMLYLMPVSYTHLTLPTTPYV